MWGILCQMNSKNSQLNGTLYMWCQVQDTHKGTVTLKRQYRVLKQSMKNIMTSRWDCCCWKPHQWSVVMTTRLQQNHFSNVNWKQMCLYSQSAQQTSISDHDRDEPMMTSKFRNHDAIWCKVDPNTKWKPGHIIDVLPNQSYLIDLDDGSQFRRNEASYNWLAPHPQ